jgi:uncharacterized surface anchored protein
MRYILHKIEYMREAANKMSPNATITNALKRGRDVREHAIIAIQPAIINMVVDSSSMN